MGNCIHPHPTKHIQRGLPPIPNENEDPYYNDSMYGNNLKRRKGSSNKKQANGPKTVIALYSFEGRDEGELSFEKGDKLVIIGRQRGPTGGWLKKFNTERTGYIPMNFVVNNIIETEE